MTRRRLRSRASLAGLVSLGMLATVSTPSVSAPPPTNPPTATSAAPGSSASGQPVASTTVTLITGDVVTVEATSHKKLTATVSTVARRADGSQPTFLQAQDGDAHYLYPSDAVGLVESGKLDRRLFDVKYLAVNGYADTQTSSLPLIVQYKQAARDARDVAASVDALPGTASPRALRSINAAATKVDRKQLNQLWTRLTGAARPATPRAIDQGVAKIWLDAKVKVNLDASVPQIGAPQAWRAGYTGTGVKVAVLDTGADLNHPDLAGKVTTSQSFVPGQEVQDLHGHGTHVAATVAGSGAASGGKYKGVAPGTDLMVGKVLSNRGSGDYSWIVAGMEWAAANGADIVSMSLGGGDTADVDPMEQAVADLTGQYGTLFVIAAGNNGGTDRTIGSPGSAPDALTVAAVDKQDALASFSSRGPTAGYVSKPDISAPGVDIVAARAAGTRMGTPVDELHTKASGTSMATPHVAGAAAILAQQHPDWNGRQLKAVLTASAVDTPATPLEEGAGRVDVARAVAQTVHGNGRIDFGQVAFPQNKPVSQTLTYTNDGDSPVTLNLASSFDSRVGPAPEGTLTLGKSTVEVPAGGSATVTVTLDLSGDGIDSWYSGIVTATGPDGVALRTAVGAFKSPKRGKITVKTISGPNMPGLGFGAFGVLRVDERSDLDGAYIVNGGPEFTVDSMVGTFSVMGSVGWYDSDGTWNILPVSAPEFTVDGDTTVTLDLRNATPLKVDTPKATAEYRSTGGVQRTGADPRLWMQLTTGELNHGDRLWSLPTGKATMGTFFSQSQHLLGAPPISMTADGLSLHPRYPYIDMANGMLDGEQRLAVVSGGTGTAEELADVDARGRLVLLDLADLCSTPVCDWSARDRVTNAHQAGAAAVLYHGAAGRPSLYWTPTDGHERLPLLSLPVDEGRALAAAVADRPVTVATKGVADSPYIYMLKFYQRDQVPARPDLSVDQRNLVEFDSRFHMDQAGLRYSYWQANRSSRTVSDHSGGQLLSLYSRGQAARTEYIGPVADDVTWNRTNYQSRIISESPFRRSLDMAQGLSRRYTEPGRHVEHWGKLPFTPGVAGLTPEQRVPGTEQCNDCRLGDTLHPWHVNRNSDGMTSGATWQADNYGNSLRGDLRLFQGDREIPLKLYGVSLIFFIVWFPTFAVPAEPGDYRLTSTYRSEFDWQKYGREMDTEWTFRSEHPGPDTKSGSCFLGAIYPNLGTCTAQRKLFLDYDVDLALDNTTKAGAPQAITVSGYGESYTDPSAKLTALGMEVSYDSGTTWNRVRAVKANGSYKVILRHPALNRTDGTVSLRTSATDEYGNTIKQTIKKAYGLR